MKTYRVEFELGTWACEIEAIDEDDAHNKAKNYAIDEVGYDIMKHVDAKIEEVINA